MESAVKNDRRITILELRRLMHSIKDLRPDICIRFRTLGEMWQSNHMRIVQITEKGALLHDETTRRLMLVADLSIVMQFELDHGFQQYQPHFHYSVDPEAVP